MVSMWGEPQHLHLLSTSTISNNSSQLQDICATAAVLNRNPEISNKFRGIFFWIIQTSVSVGVKCAPSRWNGENECYITKIVTCIHKKKEKKTGRKFTGINHPIKACDQHHFLTSKTRPQTVVIPVQQAVQDPSEQGDVGVEGIWRGIGTHWPGHNITPSSAQISVG